MLIPLARKREDFKKEIRNKKCLQRSQQHGGRRGAAARRRAQTHRHCTGDRRQRRAGIGIAAGRQASRQESLPGILPAWQLLGTSTGNFVIICREYAAGMAAGIGRHRTGGGTPSREGGLQRERNSEFLMGLKWIISFNSSIDFVLTKQSTTHK